MEGLWRGEGECFYLPDNPEMVHFLLLLVQTRAEPVFVWIWSSSGSGILWRRRAGSRRYSHRGRSSAQCICHLTPADWPGSVKEKIGTVKITINTVWITFHMINMLPFFCPCTLQWKYSEVWIYRFPLSWPATISPLVNTQCTGDTVKFGCSEILLLSKGISK